METSPHLFLGSVAVALCVSDFRRFGRVLLPGLRSSPRTVGVYAGWALLLRSGWAGLAFKIQHRRSAGWREPACVEVLKPFAHAHHCVTELTGYFFLAFK